MRIASLVPSATEIIAALGLSDSLVAITHSCDHPPGLRAARVTSTSIPAHASSAEIDRIVKHHARNGWPLYELNGRLLEELEPDLIVTQGVCDVCAVSDGQACTMIEGLAIRPEILSLHPHRLSDVLSDISLVGDAAGVPERGSALVATLHQRIERVRTLAEGRERVTVGVLEWIDPLFSAGHWTPDIVATAGGREVFGSPGDRSRELSWEEVRREDPEVLLLACCGQDTERALADLHHLEAKQGFCELTAVQSGRVFVADGSAHFSRPGPRLIDSLESLAGRLHPSTRAGGAQCSLMRVRFD